jgi:hypothetical protein
MHWLAKLGLLAGAWEGAWWIRRRGKRAEAFAAARARATLLGRPLVVVGAPDGGVTAGYGCGDVTVDMAALSSCSPYLSADVSKPLPFADDSTVVFVSCVLEYVTAYDDAYGELSRIAGGPENLFIVRVEPWTAAAYLYPGAKRTLPGALPGVR